MEEVWNWKIHRHFLFLPPSGRRKCVSPPAGRTSSIIRRRQQPLIGRGLLPRHTASQSRNSRGEGPVSFEWKMGTPPPPLLRPSPSGGDECVPPPFPGGGFQRRSKASRAVLSVRLS
uniref:Uncharacterized protein n=1 Tax=Globodera rostochiensis TaxID=31243 RepID=A0A914HZD6_GLORO